MTEKAGSEQLSLNQFVQELAKGKGVDLRGYKPSTVKRRLGRRLSQLSIGSYSEYLEKIRQEPGEITELLNTVLINVTEFFRNPQAWEVLRQRVLPRLFKELKPGDSFRAWCAGCASGEEPYSLAILLAEHFGRKLADFDVKIYATDIDDEALNVARRGEYPSDRLRRIRTEWREKYFVRDSRRRISRELRRLVIFGRSNLVSDAPISHCNLVLCRNVLIYFDTAAQKQILRRLHYALEPGGVLFLGKAESKLSNSREFRALNSRWRLFQRQDERQEIPEEASMEMTLEEFDGSESAKQELRSLQLCQRQLLETLKSGVVTLDANDVIVAHNEAALGVWRISGARLIGKRLHNTELAFRCPELITRLESTRGSADTVNFHCSVQANGEKRALSITIRPFITNSAKRAGTLIHSEDVTAQEKLQITVEQLESTGEELQSANEELETTNEELQSTNEELETTNEELQSTNEELETTNEELQSLNEELENMNSELERRTRELNEVSARYAETLERMPWPVMLVDREEKIQLWNAAAQRLFGVGSTSVVGIDLDQLPMQESFRRTLVRRCRGVLSREKPTILRHQAVRFGQQRDVLDIHLTPISRDSEVQCVLVMFGPFRPPKEGGERATTGAAAARPGNSRPSPAGGDKKSRRSR